MGFSSGLVIAGLGIPHVSETNSRFYTVPINHYPIQLDAVVRFLSSPQVLW